MAIWPIIWLYTQVAFAQSREERALELNQEMEFLMSSAAKPQVWKDSSPQPLNRRSGPSPSQVPGIENLENRFFRDEVSFQSARAEQVNDDPEPTFEEAERSYRVDGSVPQTR